MQMTDPYKELHIYYLDGVPDIKEPIRSHETFLGAWVEGKEAFLFFSAPSDDRVRDILSSAAGIGLIDKYEMTGEQWHGDKIQPYRIENLYVCPPWNRPGEKDPDVREILLDPGVVFGTGRHPTTEDCLGLIHRICSRERMDTVLDIGTGTGLLALGAAALGCRRILACDFNLLAVRTALANIRRNNFQNRILAFQARGEEMTAIGSDLLVANIHYDVMRRIIDSPGFSDRKWIILSGLLHSETRKILDLLAARGIHVVERRCPDGVWNTLLARPRFETGR